MSVETQIRRDTLANWVLVNPIISDGVQIIVRETGKKERLKFGNGIDRFSELPYFEPDVNISSIDAVNVTQDATHKFVTDEQISDWNNPNATYTYTYTDADVVNVTKQMITQGDNVTVAYDDITKKITISSIENIYTHPSSHLASMITQDATHKFVTDEQIDGWNSGSGPIDTSNLFDLTKRNDIEEHSTVVQGSNKMAEDNFCKNIHTWSNKRSDGSDATPDNPSPFDAFTTFHISWKKAIHFGLSNKLNDLAVGGWSLGKNEYRVLYEKASELKENGYIKLNNDLCMVWGKISSSTDGEQNFYFPCGLKEVFSFTTELPLGKPAVFTKVGTKYTKFTVNRLDEVGGSAKWGYFAIGKV